MFAPLMSELQPQKYNKHPKKLHAKQEPGTLPQFQLKLITWNIHNSS